MSVDQFRRAVILVCLGTTLVAAGCAALNYQAPYSSYQSNFSVDDPLPPSAARKNTELPPDDAPPVTASVPDENDSEGTLPEPQFNTKFLPER